MKKLYLILLLFNIFIYKTATSNSQKNYRNIHFSQLDNKDGLIQNTINCITQDEFGILWLGTKNGLSYYDGYSIKNYLYDEGNGNSIADNFIKYLCYDKRYKKMWISTTDGKVCCYDYKSKKFKHYNIDGHNDVSDVRFAISSNYQLFCTTNSGIFSYSANLDKFIPYIPIDNNFKSANNIYFDNDDILWIEQTDKKILRYDINRSQFIDTPKLLCLLSTFQNITITNSNKLIFNSDKGVSVYDITKDKLTYISNLLGIDDYKCAISDENNYLWIGSENGIVILDENYNKIAHYEQSETDLSNLNDSPVYSLYKDMDNNIWVGTFFGGVNYYLSNTQQFKVYSYGFSKNHLSGKAVREIKKCPDGGLYIATEDSGVNYLTKDKKIIRAKELHKKFGIKSTNVHSIHLSESDNSIWFGLFKNGVSNYNFKNHKHTNYDDILSGTLGFYITEDSDGKIWYGGPIGLYMIDKQSANNAPTKISNLNILTTININDSIKWGGVKKGGIVEINTKNKEIKKLNLIPYPNTYVTYLYIDSKDRIWAGTDNRGLYAFNKDGEIIFHYSNERLGSDAIKAIIEDNNEILWVSTENGLCSISPNTYHIDRFTTADGLPTNQFNYSSVCKREDGEIFFGTINGMISFYPEQIIYNKPRFNVKIINILINDNGISGSDKNEYLDVDISDNNSIILTYQQAQSVQVTYSGMNYKYGDKTLYSVMMEGIDKSWQFVKGQREVRFSNLTHGKYTLRIKASIDGANWDEEGASAIKITVLPPWWHTNIAYAFYILFIIICIYAAYRYTKSRLLLVMQLKNEQQQRENIELLNRQKIDFFTYVSHDLKTPLTLIISPLKQLLEKNKLDQADNNNLNIVYNNTHRMQNLIDELLTFSKIEMKQEKIVVKEGNIMLFLAEISQIFNIIASEKEIDFIVDLDDEKDVSVWFSHSKLERIIYNLIYNAFKYTKKGDYVKFSASYYDVDGQTNIKISVKDSGIGISKEQQKHIFDCYYQADNAIEGSGFGIGLSLTRSLVQMHKGEIHLISSIGKGCEFIATLNVSKSAYSTEQIENKKITTEDIEKYRHSFKEKFIEIPLCKDNSDNQLSTFKETILIVEDNIELNRYICSIFEDSYQIISAFNGLEAIKIMEKITPNIIISDVMMPAMNGLELLEHLKQNVNYSHIPFILLTAKTEITDHTEGFLRGATAYITKPFDAQNLKLMVSNIWDDRVRNIERFKQSENINVDMVTNNSSRDTIFMNELLEVIMKNIADEDFSVSDVTDSLHISRSLLHTKLKSLTNCSFTQFLRSIRIKEAKKHLSSGSTISETAFLVGIRDANYFSKCFKKELNITPTEYILQIKNEGFKSDPF
ncbi:MAG: two-component regulator propeller domain-containing protein [Rikenellaceae bacterium]